MLRMAADEDFNNRILRGLRRRNPALDVVRVQDAGLTSATDPEVLQWAADEGRVLVTHDVSTMTEFAYERVRNGQRMPCVFGVPRQVAIGTAIDELELV